MKNYFSSRKVSKIVTHAAAWSLLLFIPYFLPAYFMIKVDFGFYLLLLVLHIIIFYINYSILIPLLLFKKKWEQYLFSSAFLFLIIFFVTPLIMDNSSTIKIIEYDNSPVRGMGNVTQFADGGFRGFNLSYNIGSVFFINSFMIFFTLSLLLRFIQKWKSDENYKTRLESEKVSTELSLLKQQINPHFIFNTLNSIYSLSISNSRAVSESIIRLSSILRYVLYESEENKLRPDDELRIIDDYIKLQKLRLTDKVSVNYKLISEPAECQIEPLIIITLIENAFKYGVDTNSDSFIDIILLIIDGKLLLRVKNKIVKQVLPDPKASGVGLKNIRQRLELVYPNRYVYNVNIKNMEYSVFLKIDLSK